jgi:hypothetical protein
MKNKVETDEEKFDYFESNLTDGDMYSGITLDATVYQEENGKNRFIRVRDERERLFFYDAFVQSVLRSKSPHIKFVQKLGQPLVVVKSKTANDFYPLIFEKIDIPSDNVRFSEYVELFLECHAALGLPLPSKEGPQVLVSDSQGTFADHFAVGTRCGDVFNRLVDLIREGAQQPAFKQRVLGRIRSSTENYESGLNYVAKLFAHTSRLLVLRIDVGYAKELAQGVSVDQIRKDFMRFMNNRRHNGLFAHMVGHIWKLEEGQSRGLHYHLILFFKGSKVDAHAYLAEQIGKYWKDAITKGQGSYFSCHRNLNRYRRSGIGMMHHTDVEKLDTLNSIIRYITKKEQYLRIKDGRTFGHGIAPSLGSSPKLGRPRSKNTAVNLVAGSSPGSVNEEDQVKSNQSHNIPKGAPDLA